MFFKLHKLIIKYNLAEGEPPSGCKFFFPILFDRVESLGRCWNVFDLQQAI